MRKNDKFYYKEEEGRRKKEEARLLLFSRAVSFSRVLRLLAVMLYPGIHPTPLKIQDNSQIYGNFA